MKKKLIIFNVLLFIVLVIGGVSAYAYFVKTFTNNYTPNVNITDSKYVQIDSLEQFYDEIHLYNEPNHDFNSEDIQALNRKTLVLNVDIALQSDAIVTSDCHIDLNGKKLDLNGNKFNIRNTFAGTIAIFDSTKSTGQIVDTTTLPNTVLVETPNASFVYEPGIFDTTNITVDDTKTNKNAVVNSAFRFIYANMANTGVNGFYSTADALTAYGSVDKCTASFGAHTSNNSIGCVYTYTDLELLHTFYNYDMKIEYSSNKPNIVTNGGRVLSNASTTEVVLTVTITYANLGPISKDITIHVVAEADFAKASNEALIQYLERYYSIADSKYIFNNAFLLPLENHYFNTKYLYTISDGATSYKSDTKNEDFFIHKDGTAGNEVATATGVVLKLNDSITGMTITSSTPTATATTPSMSVVGKTSNAVDDDYAYCVGILTKLYGNIIKISKQDPGTKNEKNGYTHVSLLRDVISLGYTRLAGDLVYSIVDNSEQTYTLQADAVNTQYDELFVTAGTPTPPYLGQNISLEVKFTLKPKPGQENKPITLNIPVVYTIDNAINPGFDQFEPYFTFFDKKFSTITNNYSYNSFEIPLYFNNSYPTYTFLVYEEDRANPGKFKLMPTDGANNLFHITINTPDPTNPNNLLSGYMQQFVDPSKNVGGLRPYQDNTASKTRVDINPFMIDQETKKYYFVYVPIFTDGDFDTSKLIYRMNAKTIVNNAEQDNYIAANSMAELLAKPEIQNLSVLNYDYKSLLTVPGIVRFNVPNKSVIAEAFDDVNFFKYVYSVLNGDKDGNKDYPKTLDKNTIYTGDYFILSELLTKEIAEFNFSGGVDATAPKYSSIRGINLLKNLKKLVLSKTDVTQMTHGVNPGDTAGETVNGATTPWFDQIKYITQITNLEMLYLDNTGIYDREMTGTSFPGNTNNHLIKELQKLQKLTHLYLHNEANTDGVLTTGLPINRIYSFQGIERFTALKEINIAYNHFTSDIWLIGTILSGVTNSIYGSTGSTNRASIAISKGKNINVTSDNNANQNVPEMDQIVAALPSLEYQDKLEAGVSIDYVYKDFSTAKDNNIFGIPLNFVDSTGDRPVTYRLNSISFIADNSDLTIATGFTLKFNYELSYRHNGQPETQLVDFEYYYPVTRY